MTVCIYTYRFSEEKLLLCFVCDMIVPENFFSFEKHISFNTPTDLEREKQIKC